MEKFPQEKKETKLPKMAMITMMLALFMPSNAEARKFGELDQKKKDRVESIYADGEVSTVEKQELREMLKEKFNLMQEERVRDLEKLLSETEKLEKSVQIGDELMAGVFFEYMYLVDVFMIDEKDFQDQFQVVYNVKDQAEADIGIAPVREVEEIYGNYIKSRDQAIEKSQQIIERIIPTFVNQEDIAYFIEHLDSLDTNGIKKLADKLKFSDSEEIKVIAGETGSQGGFLRHLSYLDPEEKLKIINDAGFDKYFNQVYKLSMSTSDETVKNVASIDVFLQNAKTSGYLKEDRIKDLENKYSIRIAIFNRLVDLGLINREDILID